MEKAWNTISRNIYTIFRILSLDILAGVFCGYTFARLILDTDSPPVTPVILCLTVWLIYTLDHLLDARNLRENALKPVYVWHWKNRKTIWTIWLLGVVVTLYLSFSMLPGRILVFGGILGSLVFIYTLVHQGLPGIRSRYLFKECWISIIYSAGIWGVPLFYHAGVLDVSLGLAILIYYLLVLINVLIYSFFEYHLDRRESLKTFATVFGKRITWHLLTLLLLTILSLILVSFLFINEEEMMIPVYLILLCMAMLLGLILVLPRFFLAAMREPAYWLIWYSYCPDS